VPSSRWTLVALFFLTGCKPGSLTLAELVQRNTNAMGGRAAVENVQAVEIELHIVDPKFEVDAVYHASRPGRMRIDIQVKGGHVFTEAFDGTNGWEWSPKDGAKLASEKGTAALRHGVEFPGTLFGLEEMERRGHKLELVGRETLEGINYYVLRLTLNDGYVVSFYVDPNSWLITRRRDVRPLHVDIDPTPTTIEQKRSDFRQIGGVRFPFSSVETDLASGKELERSTIKSLKVNPPLDQSMFSKP
jgi:hypothetical protein